MREHPILCAGPVVRHIIAGIQTQDRRPLTRRNSFVDGHDAPSWNLLDLSAAWVDPGPSPVGNPGPYLKAPCPTAGTVHRVYPRVQVGDVLWCRETWRPVMESWASFVEYRAGGTRGEHGDRFEGLNKIALRFPGARKDVHSEHWHPSIHMPRWASRLTLEVTGVRVERLQDISEADARAEGIPTNEAGEFLAPERLAPWRFTTARDAFAVWWDEFYGVGMVDSWEASPWVCAVTFKVVTP